MYLVSVREVERERMSRACAEEGGGGGDRVSGPDVNRGSRRNKTCKMKQNSWILQVDGSMVRFHTVSYTLVLHNCLFDLASALWTNLVLLIEGSKFALKSCVYIQCIQCHLSGCNRREQYWTNRPCPFPLPGSAPGCRTGNRAKLSSTQAEPVQAIKSGVAYFPSISCTKSWRRSRYNQNNYTVGEVN